MSSAPRPELDKRFDPQSFEMTLVPAPGGVGPVPSGSGVRRRPAVHARHSAAERHRASARRPRPRTNARGRPRALEEDAGPGGPLGPRRRPRGHRDADGRRARPHGADGEDPPRRGTRALPRRSAASGPIARRGDILNQIRRLGCSCDFSREYYTLDEPRSKAVRRAFTELYHQGLAYRDSRMVNWCTRCATVLSDLEVNHVESSGHLWSVAYPLEDGSGDLVVATTRPETILGDTAVAVHPEDERYTALVGKTGPPAPDGSPDSRHRGRDGRPDVRDGRREDHARARPERLRGGAAARPRPRSP